MQAAKVTGLRDLHADEIDVVSGGDKARDAAVIEAYKVINQIELDLIDVEPVPHVSMKL